MKHWKDMNKFEKIEAVREIYKHGIIARDMAAKIPGATASSVIALYKRNRSAMKDIPLAARGQGSGSRGRCEPTIKPEQMPELIRMRSEGKTVEQMANAMCASPSSVRRAFIRHEKPLSSFKAFDGPAPSVGSISPRPEGWRVRVTDTPDHPLARLIHEGPTPEQRALMQEVRA